MFSKKEAQALRIEFWTCFGIYMTKHKPKFNRDTKWTSYNSRVKDIAIKCESEEKTITVCLDFQHRSEEMRAFNYEQLLELKSVLEDTMECTLEWLPSYALPSGKQISRIRIEKRKHSIYNKEDWDQQFRFFEKHLVKLDEFWSDYYDLFKELEQLAH